MLLSSLAQSSAGTSDGGLALPNTAGHQDGDADERPLAEKLRHEPQHMSVDEEQSSVQKTKNNDDDISDEGVTDVQKVVMRHFDRLLSSADGSVGHVCIVAPGEEYLRTLMTRVFLKKRVAAGASAAKVIFFDTTTEIGIPFSIKVSSDGVTTVAGRRRLGMTTVLSDLPTSKCQLFVLDGDGPASTFEVMYLRGMADDGGNVIVASRPWLASMSDAAAMVRDVELSGGFPDDVPVGGVFIRRFDSAPVYRSDALARIVREAPWRDERLDRYDALGRALDHEATVAGGGLEGHSGQLVKERQLYISLASMPNVRTICEIGFNAGHSASLWLLANPTARVIAFDLFLRPYVQHNLEFLKSDKAAALGVVGAANRLDVYAGSSTETVPTFVRNNPNLRCDLLSVDGSHHMEDAIKDIKNMHHLANETFNILVIDDTNCHMGWCVDETTMRMEREKKIKSLVRLAEHPDLNEHRFQRGVTMFQYFPKN